ncbi:uncharacterized protein LOC143027985 [Oratosquilla oratoria]|uniref:uncharacterized protein LOC143027985 n=1 Tax=Oratosquilla oratoria TaxID=337810 RepID=UPI003F770489
MIVLVVGVVLSVALVVALLLSGFIIFVLLSTHKMQRGSTLLHIQLGVTGIILSLTFLALSTPSYLAMCVLIAISFFQGRWILATGPSRGRSGAQFPTPNNQSSARDEFPTGTLLNYLCTIPTTRGPSDLAGNLSTAAPPVQDATGSGDGGGGGGGGGEEEEEEEEEKAEDKVPECHGGLLNTSMPLVIASGSEFDNVTVAFAILGEAATEEEEEEEEELVQGRDTLCQAYGFLLVMIHTAGVWMVVGFHVDKFCAIAAPLRYNQLATRRRVMSLSAAVWVLALLVAIPPLVAKTYGYAFAAGGACLPRWHGRGALPYAVTLTLVTVFLPAALLMAVNGRILVIARHHNHRIFSAIFEVMMSAQATVTHQKNPFDLPPPRKKQKSAWTIIEQLAVFVLSYCPYFGVVLWESTRGVPANKHYVVFGAGLLLVSPLTNAFIYGVKYKSIRQAFRNYLRKKISKTEVKHEIQARIPSAQNSRRPSFSSLPFQQTLQRRMSDYLLQDKLLNITANSKLVRRSSDLSWHPLDSATPSPTRLRRPFDIPTQSLKAASTGDCNLSLPSFESHSPLASSACASNFLTVPTFEVARNYYVSQQRVRLSISSMDSETSYSMRESRTEEETLTASIDHSPLPDSEGSEGAQQHQQQHHLQLIPAPAPGAIPLGSRRRSSGGVTPPPLEPTERRPWNPPGMMAKLPSSFTSAHASTPLLYRAYNGPAKSSSNSGSSTSFAANMNPLSASAPFVTRTLEAILSVKLAQNLLLRRRSESSSRSIESLAMAVSERKRIRGASAGQLLDQPSPNEGGDATLGHQEIGNDPAVAAASLLAYDPAWKPSNRSRSFSDYTAMFDLAGAGTGSSLTESNLTESSAGGESDDRTDDGCSVPLLAEVTKVLRPTRCRRPSSHAGRLVRQARRNFGHVDDSDADEDDDDDEGDDQVVDDDDGDADDEGGHDPSSDSMDERVLYRRGSLDSEGNTTTTRSDSDGSDIAEAHLVSSRNSDLLHSAPSKRKDKKHLLRKLKSRTSCSSFDPFKTIYEQSFELAASQGGELNGQTLEKPFLEETPLGGGQDQGSQDPKGFPHVLQAEKTLQPKLHANPTTQHPRPPSTGHPQQDLLLLPCDIKQGVPSTNGDLAELAVGHVLNGCSSPTDNKDLSLSTSGIHLSPVLDPQLSPKSSKRAT